MENNNNITVNKSELEQIEKEILMKDKQKEEALKQQLEQEIRSKIEQETKLKELEDKNKKLEELIINNNKKLDEEKLAREQELNKIKEELAKPKGIINTQSPFQKEPEKKMSFNNLTKEQVIEIDLNSKKAFMDFIGMKDKEWAD